MNIEAHELIIELDDHIAAQRLYMRPRKVIRIILYTALIFLAVGYIRGVQQLIETGGDSTTVWIIGLFFLYLIFFFFFFHPYRSRRLYQQNKSLQKPCEVRLTDTMLWARNNEAESRTGWDEFCKWKENRKMFLIFRADNFFHILPKRALGGEENIDALRKVLLEKIGPEDD